MLSSRTKLLRLLYKGEFALAEIELSTFKADDLDFLLECADICLDESKRYRISAERIIAKVKELGSVRN